ncbi:MAG: hypothetical protein HY895_21120 [Deltaproteobacteria bacterium]|nr:hypothetical protein [Deltaproteobacteria bacterium]
MDAETTPRLTLTVTPGSLSRFLPLLGQGFTVQRPAGASVEGFLCRACGIARDYLRERVQTVFLNGKAIDDLAAAMVNDGSTIALSAAMPGLAGAVLRKGGAYAAMRRQISHAGPGDSRAGGPVSVTIKLFNLVARELGPGFLEQGVLIHGASLQDFFRRQDRGFGKIGRAADIDGRPVDFEKVPEIIPGNRLVLLALRPAGPHPG